MAEPAPTPTPELKTYKGSCHCGKFKFTIEIPELKEVISCNCSICVKKGWLLVFPGHNWKVDQGLDEMVNYEFGGKSMGHKFCPTCGSCVMGQRYNGPPGKDTAFNARCIPNIDIPSLGRFKYDGAALAPPYIPPQISFEDFGPTEEFPKLYTGSCHCGNVQMGLRTKGLEGKEVLECDCSICVRNGGANIYPQQSQVAIKNNAPITGYTFGNKVQTHNFCSICGVYCFITRRDLDRKEWDELKLGEKGFRFESWTVPKPVNLRLFEGVEWAREGKEGVKVGRVSMKGDKMVFLG